MKDMLSYPLYVPPGGGHAVLHSPSVILASSKENYDDERVKPAHQTVTAVRVLLNKVKFLTIWQRSQTVSDCVKRLKLICSFLLMCLFLVKGL